MNGRNARREIARLASAGVRRPEMYRTLCAAGANPHRAARLVASWPDPGRCAACRIHVWLVVLMACVQAVFALFDGLAFGQAFSPAAGWILGGSALALGLLFALAFHRNQAGAYNAYLLMALLQLPFQFADAAQSPFSNGGVLVLNLALLIYVWWVRSLLFPDFGFLSPKRSDGNYVFRD